MSLTLPYPNMFFVPLDILTAEEMNEITANVDFIANQFPISASNIGTGAVTTAKIANAAVTSDKVDWGSLNAKYANASSSTALTTNFQEMLSVNVSDFPIGSDLLVLYSGTATAMGITACSHAVALNGTRTFSVGGSSSTTGGVALNMSSSRTIQKTADLTTISTLARKDNSAATVTFSDASLTVVRIG